MDSKELIAAVQAAIDVRVPRDDRGESGTPFVVVPEGYTVESLGHLLPSPLTTVQKVMVRDTASLIAYVLAFKTATTRGFAVDNYRSGNPHVKVVIDYHGPDEPSHASHVVTLDQGLSEAWGRWSKVSGTALSQKQMAEFLEENSVDIVAPDAATMMEIAGTIEANKSAVFKSGIRLHNGNQQLTYNETTDATAGQGKLTIPEKIKLAMPIFENGATIEFEAWFRYRITEGRLALVIELHRPRFIFDAAFKVLVKELSAGAGIPVHLGSV